MGKPINKQPSSKFHVFINKILDQNSTKIIKQDIDSAIVYIPSYKIVCLFEIKRSYIGIKHWKPFKEDYSNYIALFKFKEQAGIDKVFVLYYVKENLEAGIKIFELKGLEKEGNSLKPVFEKKEIYNMESFKSNFLLPLFTKNDLIRETDLQGARNPNNIYSFLDMISNYQNMIYVENEDNWIMLISSKEDYSPICIYKEICGNSDTSAFSFEQNYISDVFEKISKRLGIPYFEFYYNKKNNLENFKIRENDSERLMNQEDFVKYFLDKTSKARTK
jgi:hypothetical protein